VAWVAFRREDAKRLLFSDNGFDAVASTRLLEHVPDVDAVVLGPSAMNQAVTARPHVLRISMALTGRSGE
jgi:2-polyprenyl-3-methyl-5-hydroxy-6-metoxy-1,4-benzoquinol methylase